MSSVAFEGLVCRCAGCSEKLGVNVRGFYPGNTNVEIDANKNLQVTGNVHPVELIASVWKTAADGRVNHAANLEPEKSHKMKHENVQVFGGSMCRCDSCLNKLKKHARNFSSGITNVEIDENKNLRVSGNFEPKKLIVDVWKTHKKMLTVAHESVNRAAKLEIDNLRAPVCGCSIL